VFADEALSPQKVAGQFRSQGDDAYMKHQYAEAVKLYSDAIKAEPSNEKNFYKRYRAYNKLEQLDSAVRDLDEAIKLDPKYTSAYAFRAKLLLEMGRCPQSLADYNKVLELKPNHGDAKKMIMKAKECSREVEDGLHYMEQGDYEKADYHFSQAMTLTGISPYVKLLRARTRYHMGMFFESIADSGAVLKILPDSQDALLIRGMAYYRVAEHATALQHLRLGLQKDPEHQETKLFLKQVQKLLKYVKQGDKEGPQQALSSYGSALAIDPSHTHFNKVIHLKICKVYAQLKQVNEARHHCETALRLDESRMDGEAMIDPLLVLAEMLSSMATETPECEEALRAWQRALEMDSHNQQVQDGRHKAEVALKQSKQKNYYKILEVQRHAKTPEIKKAYRRLAKENHPDKQSCSTNEERAAVETKFHLIAEAYEVLSSEDLRSKYDRGEDVFPNQGGGQQQQRRSNGFPFNFHHNF